MSSGLYEIHISVAPHDICGLRLFCLDNKIKPILAAASSGVNKNQLMISRWKHGSREDVIARAEELAASMRAAGIEVHRVKVEAMAHNPGVPREPDVINYPREDRSKYFEFHIKYAVGSSAEYRALERHARQFAADSGQKCAVSFSAFKETISALCTLRTHASIGADAAERHKDDLIALLKRNGIHTTAEIAKEFSVYDTAPEYDDGWL